MIHDGIDYSTLTDEQVLFFIRIRGKKSYFNMVYTDAFLKLFTQVKEYRTISEYKKNADVHINLDSIERDFLHYEERQALNEIVDINDVIHRCRGLRSMEYSAAKRLVFRTYLFFSRFYEANPQLKLIVSGAVDNYVMDMMNRVGASRGITFVGVTDSFMSPEYKLITLRGEPSGFSQPEESAAKQFYERIKKSALSPIAPKKDRAVRHAIYCFCSYYYRFFVRYILQHKIMGKLGYEYHFAPLFKMFYHPKQILAAKHLKPLEDIRFDADKKYAYVPLHYYPEATIDYWLEDNYHVDYEDSLLDTIKKLQNDGYDVVVKEHPAFYLAREASTYKKLLNAGCQLVSPFVPTKVIFEKIDLVVVWNGSTGIEAIVHKKPVVKVTNSYYGDGLIDGLDMAATPTVPDDELGINVIKKVLASSFRTL